MSNIVQLRPTQETYPINQEAYDEWLEFRKLELRKKVGPAAQRKQHKLLAQYPPDQQQEIIDNSIMNSYQGLFPLRAPQRINQPRPSEQITGDLAWLDS